jgi:hypothetical protein
VNLELQIAKNKAALPVTRDYMFTAEAASARHHDEAQAATVENRKLDTFQEVVHGG